VLGLEVGAVDLDARGQPRAQLRVLAGDGLRQPVADPGDRHVPRRVAGRAQALQQVGVLVPDDELGIEELPGATAYWSSASRPTAKHHAAKSSRMTPSTVSGKATAAPASMASRSGSHQPGSGSTSSFMTTAYGDWTARRPALTGCVKPWGGAPLSTMTSS
jgi:hypothetical protein